jgi:hypothetical protein
MNKHWHDSAWRDYEYWQSQDKVLINKGPFRLLPQNIQSPLGRSCCFSFVTFSSEHAFSRL